MKTKPIATPVSIRSRQPARVVAFQAAIAATMLWTSAARPAQQDVPRGTVPDTQILSARSNAFGTSDVSSASNAPGVSDLSMASNLSNAPGQSTVTSTSKRSMAASSASGLSVASSGANAPGVSTQSSAAAESPTSDGTTLDLVVGVQHPLQIDKPLTRVAIADPAVADVMVTRGTQGGNLLLIAKHPGVTSLLVWTREQAAPRRYTVKVSNAATRAVLGDAGPSVSVVGDTTIIRGSAPTVAAHQQAVAAALAAGGTMSGNGNSNGKDASAGSGAGTAAGGTIVDQSTIAVSPVVQVDVKVVEFSRTVLKNYGINLQKIGSGFLTGIANPGTPVNTTGIAVAPIASAFSVLAAGTSSGLSAGLSILQSDGLARVLAEPTLVALSGQSASFLAGGEVPVPVPQSFGTTTIEYKPYGVGLTVTPTVLAHNRIALKVAPEASDLDFVHAVTISGVSVPALTTRRADTTVELGDGESFVIGGLIDRETITNIDKVPFLGDLPVIGAFFKSLNYQQADKELVIVVTPHLVSPLAKGTVVPLPGETAEQRDGPVWRTFVGGMAGRDALPGFSR
jgi:pilus assembly protein CpaC